MKRKIAILTALMAVLPLLQGCQTKTRQHTFFAMDAVCSVQLPDTKQSQELLSRAEALVRKIEDEYSKTKESGLPQKLTAAGGIITLDDEQATFFAQILSVCEMTDGAFDPTLGAVSALWDFGGENEKVPTSAEREEALLHTGYKKLHLGGRTLHCDDPWLRLDLGGAAKGYAAQKLFELLQGQTDYAVINLGGNIALLGEKKDGSPFTVGIRSPFDGDKLSGTLTLAAPAFLSVSGNYERFFEKDGKRYHHILSPKDGMPAENGVASVCVISRDGALSDMLSTALFVMGAEKAAAFWKDNGSLFDAVIMLQNGEVICSDTIASAFRTADGTAAGTFSSMLNDLEVGG